MSWLAQALHVLRKDVRATRWTALLYMVAATINSAAALLSWERWMPSLWTFVVCALGAFLVGQVVHNDSPTRVDSFWATRPLIPSAVFAAKVLTALLVLVVPALGELLYLRSHDISTASALTLAGQPIAAYTVLLATAIMVAVLTPSFRVFVVAFAGLALAGRLAAQLLPFWFDSADVLLPAWLLYLLVFAGILVLGWQQYRTREPRRGYMFAALLVLLTMMIPVRTVARERATGTVQPLPAPAPTPLLHVEEASVRPAGPRSLLYIRARVADVALPNLYSVYIQDVSIATAEQPRAALLRHHGTWFREEMGVSGGNVVLNGGNPEMTLSYEITPAEAALLERPDARVIVHADVTISEMRPLLDMPAVSGARAATDGQFVRLVDMERGRDLVLQVRQSVVRHRLMVPQRRPQNAEGRFELVNPERKEAVVLQASYDRNAETSVVLPASHARATHIWLSPAEGGPNRWKRVNPDDAWLAGARLRLVAPVAVGTYTLNAEGPVRRAAPAR